MTLPLRRARPSAAGSPRAIRLAALRAPLLVKLVGANLFVVAALGLGWFLTETAGRPAHVTASLAIALLALVVAIHTVLVVVALRPIVDMEAVAAKVWKGDLGARVERSAVADQSVLRVGSMLNILLDSLADDRERMRALAAQVIDVGDRERAALAAELHDSTAQRLAALLLQVSAAARDCPDPGVAARLEAARDAAVALTDEIRVLAQEVHPGVLDDLGLTAALRKLARDSSSGTGVDVDVDQRSGAAEVPKPVARVLYRVAREAVQNAIRHAQPRHVRLTVEIRDSLARLEVTDDGRGFDSVAVERQPRGTGLISLRDRLALVDGWLEVRTASGAGTTLIASVPLSRPGDANRQERS